MYTRTHTRTMFMLSCWPLLSIPCHFLLKFLIFHSFPCKRRLRRQQQSTYIKCSSSSLHDCIQQYAQVYSKSARLCLLEHYYAQLSVSSSISISQSINQKAITLWAAVKLKKNIQQTEWSEHSCIFLQRNRRLFYGQTEGHEKNKKYRKWVNEWVRKGKYSSK